MFNILLLSIYCFSLVFSSAINPKFTEKYIDGKQYTIKNLNITYTQHVSNHGQCMVELNEQGEKSNLMSEGEIVKIKTKWFKVEDCQLNRAYVASCGSKLFYQMRDIVCSYVVQHYEKKIRKQRQVDDDLINFIDKSYYDKCCNNACTIYELVQYCPSTW